MEVFPIMMGIATYITIHTAIQATVVQTKMGLVGNIPSAVPTNSIVTKLGVPMTGNVLNIN